MRNNLISGALSPEQKAEILQCLTQAQTNMGFLVSINAKEKKRLTKMGAKSLGYVDECIATFDEFKNLLPGDLDMAELKRDRLLYENLSIIAVKVRALNESLQDSLVALSSDMMTVCNDGYAVLKRSGQRDNGVKLATERISQRYKSNGNRTAKASV